MPEELIAVRHGQSLANAAFLVAEGAGLADAGVRERDADVPLTDLGCEEAGGLGRWLATLPDGEAPQLAVCSPYLRARETTRIAFDELAAAGRPVPERRVDERLRDRELGVLEMLTSTAIRQRFPEETDRRHRVGDFYYRPPGGESFPDVALRVRAFLADLDRADAARRVLLVVHDSVVTMLRYVLEGLTEEELREVEPVRNASVTRWTRDRGRMRLVHYNRTDHLR